jgi:hypothetical protein
VTRKLSKKEAAEQEKVATLRPLRDAWPGDAALATVRAALAEHSALVVAAAATVVKQQQLAPLAKDLAPAWAWFVGEAVKRDPGCRAKQALVEALVALEDDPDDLLLAAVRYRQIEPAFGGPVDTAALLRAHAAVGLANLRHPQAANCAAELLADGECNARAGAARALSALSAEVAVPLLRFKARTGDTDARVIGECFASLLQADPAASVAFVGEFLRDPPELAEQAAIALGESRRPDAFARLQAWHESLSVDPVCERIALVAMGMVRSDASREYLLTVVRAGTARAALAAAEGLAICRHDEQLRAATLASARARDDKALLQKIDELLSAS